MTETELTLAEHAFETDSYLTSIDVDVVASGGDGQQGPYVVLSDTILYPEGGGQPSDFGTVAGFTVLALERGSEGFRHYLEAPSGSVALNGRVTVTLDWARRFDHMQQHSAQHLLTALAHTHFERATTSFHLGESACDIELDGDPLSPAEQDTLEDLAARAIRENRTIQATRISLEEYERRDDIRTRGLPDHHSGSVRLIEIDDIDRTACGGTHVSSTGQIESIKLLGTEAMRGGTRLHWTAGGRIRSRLAGHESRSAALRSVLGVANDELVYAAEQRVEQLREAQKRVRSLEEELADAVALSVLSRKGTVQADHFDGKDGGFLRLLAARFAEHATGEVALFTSSSNGDNFFALAVGSDPPGPVDAFGSVVAQMLNGRGGGKGNTFQGKAGSLERLDEAVGQLRTAVDA